MTCSPSDLRDYFFGELHAEERRAVEDHIAACAACRNELNELGLTRSALLCVPDEEPPRRIAFVSDKVFELRWWQRIWASGPQLGFVSSCILALAIVAHGFVSEARVEAAVTKAVAVAREERRADMLAVGEYLEHVQKQMGLVRHTAYYGTPGAGR